MSRVSQQITGTFIADEASGKPPVWQWVQDEVRVRFRSTLERFAAQQPESLDVSLVQVVDIRPDRLVCRIPCCLVDHESPHPFHSEVLFSLNPLTGQASRK